jgi:hypothetical protein
LGITGDNASNLPGLGDVRSCVLKLAASDPTALGMSVMFPYPRS